MTKEDREDLICWMRHLEFYDQDDDGIGEMVVSFKIRDERDRMRKIFKSMKKKDAKRIAELYVGDFHPCEDFADDWNDPDSGFACEFGWDKDREEIWISANFRT